MSTDWKALAKAVYDAWARNGDVHAEMHAIRCALEESRGCEAEHPTRPYAKCSHAKGHGGHHAWTRYDECSHPHLRTDRQGFRVCEACGVYRGKATESESEGSGGDGR